MKRILIAAALLMLITSPVMAKTTITLPPGYGQDQFKDLSTDLGLAISYMPLAPAEPLGGLLPGFDIGVEVTAVPIDKDKTYWQAVETVSNDIPGTLPFPKLHAQLGLPVVPIDIGVVYAKIPGSDITYTGYELKYAVLKGGVATPAIAVRGAYTKLDGIDDLDINTKSLDVSISKGILMLTPYAGYGIVSITSKEKSPVVTLEDEKITEGKAFVGCKFSLLPVLNIVVEGDFAKVNAYSLRLNLHF